MGCLGRDFDRFRSVDIQIFKFVDKGTCLPECIPLGHVHQDKGTGSIAKRRVKLGRRDCVFISNLRCKFSPGVITKDKHMLLGSQELMKCIHATLNKVHFAFNPHFHLRRGVHSLL